jgi:hypothetical protein
VDGPDYGALIKMLPAVIGGLGGSSPGQAAFQQSFLQGQQLAQQERDQKQREQQARQAQGANYLMGIAEHAQNFDDPVALDQFLSLAETAGSRAGYVQPGDLKGKISIAPSKIAAKRLKELSDQLDTYEKNGYSLDDLASSGAVVELKDGSHLPIANAIDLTRKRPLSQAGSPIAKPQKADLAASTEEERFVQKWAKDQGKTFTQLTADEELQARKAFRESGRADKTVAPGGVDAQFNDLVELWKQANPGKEVPASVRTKLRAQANAVNDRPAATPLVGADDVDGIADAIISGDQPPTLQGLYRLGAPVRAALARKGYNLANAQLDWAATQRHLSTLNGPQQTRLRQATDNAEHSLDVIDALAQQWKGGRFAILNKANLALAKSGAYGREAATIARQLEGQIADVTSELANVYMGGNSPTDHALALASKNLSAEWDERTLRDMIKMARTNLQIRANSIKNTGVIGVGGGSAYLPPTPAAGVTGAGGSRVYYDADGNPIKK